MATNDVTEITLDDLHALGFKVAGEANVQANAEESDEDKAAREAAEALAQEMATAAALLWKHGTRRKQTASGRPKRTLGDANGISPYRVIVTKDKS